MSDPQQQPAQPQGYPPQQYPQPQYSQPQQYPQSPAQSGGSLGRVAFIVSLVSLAIGLLVTLSFPLLARSVADYSLIGVVSAIGNAIVLIASVAALILGLIAMRRTGQQILAGIAIGIGASAIIGILVSWASNAAFTLLHL